MKISVFYIYPYIQGIQIARTICFVFKPVNVFLVLLSISLLRFITDDRATHGAWNIAFWAVFKIVNIFTGLHFKLALLNKIIEHLKNSRLFWIITCPKHPHTHKFIYIYIYIYKSDCTLMINKFFPRWLVFTPYEFFWERQELESFVACYGPN